MRLRSARLFVLAFVIMGAGALVFGGAQARVEGHVTDSEGKPIANARVTVTSPEVSTFLLEVEAD